MRLRDKVIATLKSLPTIITLRRCYRCDQCGKMHRFIGREFSPYVGWWKQYVFISEKCAMKVIRQANARLYNDAAIQLFREALDDE